MTRVGVIADWSRCSRACFWSEFLAEVDPNVEVSVYHLADYVGSYVSWTIETKTINDKMVKTGRTLMQELEHCDILLVNWDVLNGDPDFGSHIALRWFEHRRGALMKWVHGGRTLILEGQATLSVPTQRAYDALFGRAELSGSSPSALCRFDLEVDRVGTRGQLTQPALRSELFGKKAELQVRTNQTFNSLFPEKAGQMWPQLDKNEDFSLLYRGWLRKNPLRRRTLKWVPIARTADRTWNHTILAGAVHGNGLIYATTMFLAGSGQKELVRHLLTSQEKRSSFPRQSSVSRWWSGYWRQGVGAVSGLVAIQLLQVGSSWRPLIGYILSFVVIALVFIWGSVGSRLWNGVRDMLGI